MSTSIYKIIKGNRDLIVCFGGMLSQFGKIPPFEFLNFLSRTYDDSVDFLFLIDKKQCWYHNGIEDLTNNIDETVIYLNSFIENGNYDKVLFMGISAGGYAAILFGSLCKNIKLVISFIPQTLIKNPVEKKYSDLKSVINDKTLYILFGDITITNLDDTHHILHCENIECFTNVTVLRNRGCNMKHLRDNGFIKKYIDEYFLGI
jgi:hypothetical protein